MASDDSQRPIGVDAPPVTAPPGPAPEHVFSRKITTGAMTARASGGLRKLASNMASSYPEMDVHQHLQDAARELDSGRTHSAQRHVNAAIFGLQPLQLRRHGVYDDAGHMRGKAMMQQAHRHLLLIKDIEDVHGSNRAITSQRRDEQDRQAQERAAMKTAPVAASWDAHLHVIELVAVHESAAGRRALAKKGLTAYGTSYPMPNAAYVGKALKAVGRVKPGKRGVLKRAIQKNARRFGVSLKGTWAEGGAKNMGSEFNLAAYGIEDHYVHELAFRFRHGWIRIGGDDTKAKPKKETLPGGRTWAEKYLTDAQLKSVRTGSPWPGPAGSAENFGGGNLGTIMGSRGKLGSGARGRLGKLIDGMGSATEAAAGGTGLPLESRVKLRPATYGKGLRPATYGKGLRPADRVKTYRALRAKGHSHNKAMAVLRSIGRSFQAGSAVPPAGFSNPSGPPPFPVNGAWLN
jgi:hypothetical protein